MMHVCDERGVQLMATGSEIVAFGLALARQSAGKVTTIVSEAGEIAFMPKGGAATAVQIEARLNAEKRAEALKDPAARQLATARRFPG